MIGICSFVACGNQIVYDQTKEIKTSEWAYADSLVFEYTVRDTSALNELLLDISVDRDSFKYENLYCRLNTILSDGKELSQLISFDVLTKEAIAAASCYGSKCTVPIVLQEKASFDKAGNYKLIIAQESREEKLKGVDKIRFYIRTLKS